ncbi:hypothetical protein BJV77DRAFT_1050567, partial [Russula vinacea]
ERGSVRQIKCRRCPDATFKTWNDFKRHCNTKELHPLKVYFCDDCGDFFARPDSLKRHREHPPAECLSRSETQRIHNVFIASLMGILRTGEDDVGTPFSQISRRSIPNPRRSISSTDVIDVGLLHRACRIHSCLFLFCLFPL